MANYTFENEYTFKDGDKEFKVTDDQGNYLYGWTEERKANHSDHIFKSYHIVGANFKGSKFTKLPDRWKRDKSGSVSKGFINWLLPTHEALINNLPGFYNKN